MASPPVLWLITDGRPGHRSQLAGVAVHLRAQTGCRTEWIKAPDAKMKGFSWWLSRRFPPGVERSAPDWIIVAGERTHWAGLAARRVHGGRLIVLMRPSLPYYLFDLCCVPRHDAPPVRANILPTLGVANAVQPSRGHDFQRGLILLGGESRHHQWDTAAMVPQVCEIMRYAKNIRFTLADSPRTPALALETIAKAAGTWAGQALETVSYADAAEGWLVQQLRHCATIWVTEDSVSMVYEALTSGAATGVLHVPARRANSRVAKAIQIAVDEKLVTPFHQWQRMHVLSPPGRVVNEARRLAQAIVKCFPAAGQ